jgi:hypothetical protein
MVDQFYDEATNQYINDYYRAVMVTKDNYPKFIDKINGGYINNGFAVINSDIDSSITNPSEIKYLKRLISNPQSLSFSFQFKYKDSPALEKEIGAKRMHVVKEDDV